MQFQTFCGNFTLALRNVQGIFYARISTYAQSVVRNLVLGYVSFLHLRLQKHQSQ